MLDADKVFKRKTDPYYRLAEELTIPSLAQRKSMSLAAATVEKNRRLDPREALAAEIKADAEMRRQQQEQADLLDIAESSLRQVPKSLYDFGREQIFDLAPNRTEQQRQAESDLEAGVTSADRQRLVSDKQQAVADAYVNDDWMGVASSVAEAALPTIADSSGAIAEIGAMSLATGLAGPATAPLWARKGQQAKKVLEQTRAGIQAAVNAKKSQPEKLLSAGLDKGVELAKKAPKAATQVSLAAVDQTQANISEFRELHGADPTKENVAGMLAINLLTLSAQPGIVKNFFVPDFKKGMIKEIRNLGANLKGGSNLKAVGMRFVEALKATGQAAGAEGIQEYVQTWGEALNVGMGPEQQKEFWSSVLEIAGNEDKQLEAIVAGFLGAGAGGTIRGATAIPAATAGIALDTAKGTAKTAVNLGVKGTKAVTNAASYKLLSQEDRDAIKEQYEAKSAAVDISNANLKNNIESVRSAKTFKDLVQNQEVAALTRQIQADNQITDEDLQDTANLKKMKNALQRVYNRDIDLARAELEASNIASIARKTGKNVKTGAQKAAQAVADIVDVDIQKLQAKAAEISADAVRAVKEVKSGTALGLIELGITNSKKNSKLILAAAKDLSLKDIRRVAAVIGEIDPDLGRKLKGIEFDKTKTLEKLGRIRNKVISKPDLPKPIRDIVKNGTVKTDEAASLNVLINEITSSQIADLETLAEVDNALRAYENSAVFKEQNTKGVMSPKSMEVNKDRIESFRRKLNKKKKSKTETFVDELSEKGIIPILGDTAAVKKLMETWNTDTAQGIVKKVKDLGENMKVDLSTPEKEAEFEAKVASAIEKAKRVVVGPKKRKTVPKPSDPEKVQGSLFDKLTTVSNLLAQNNSDFTDQMIEDVEVIVELVNKSGFETREDFADLMEQFPGMANNQRFYNKISNYFPDDPGTPEQSDNVDTATSSDSDIEARYQESFKGCKIP